MGQDARWVENVKDYPLFVCDVLIHFKPALIVPDNSSNRQCEGVGSGAFQRAQFQDAFDNRTIHSGGTPTKRPHPLSINLGVNIEGIG